MNKPEFTTNRVDSDDKSLKGLRNDGQVEFKCEGCGRSLLVLQLTSIGTRCTAEVFTRVAVRCESCGDFSLVQQISGQFHAGAPSDDMAFDVLDDDTNVPQADVLFKAWKK